MRSLTRQKLVELVWIDLDIDLNNNVLDIDLLNRATNYDHFWQYLLNSLFIPIQQHIVGQNNTLEYRNSVNIYTTISKSDVFLIQFGSNINVLSNELLNYPISSSIVSMIIDGETYIKFDDNWLLCRDNCIEKNVQISDGICSQIVIKLDYVYNTSIWNYDVFIVPN